MRYIALVFLVLLTGCKNSKIENAPKDHGFDVFFEKFASDSVFQKKHFDFPVIAYYSDVDLPFDLKEKSIDEDSYFYTDFTKDKSIYDVSVERKKDSVIYTRRLRDTYHLPLIYKFAYKNKRWMFVEFSDLTD
ncbi:MAG: hypothetical protein CFE23_06810 [Flavobacterium sp. BFFFF1]|uniref:DUF4348 domain-containing protein n=1 Tax=Flavobacterium sp. BFFFF1 TaxID=2015557 RepID=UPI000BC44F1B|nr:DUF4348 domain-containing protein [Flavobacterium sp. BFFFF1]OYU80937.1 MAG: hypothetical protein CFE23_06810 [Flavobacterium sp. BFFFF1]